MKKASAKVKRQKLYNYNEQLRGTHNDVKYDIKNIKCGVGSKKCGALRMCLNVNNYSLKQRDLLCQYI